MAILLEENTYTLSDLKWTNDTMFIPGSLRPVSFRYLACRTSVQGTSSSHLRPFQKICTVYHVWTGEVVIEFTVTPEEERSFSKFESLIIQSKPGKAND